MSATIINLADYRSRNYPESARSLYDRASAIDESDPVSAIPLYERSLELDPLFGLSWTNLGNCHFRTGSHEAKWCYLKALACDPTQPEALYNLGYLSLERGDHAHAIKMFRLSLESDPRFADTHFNLALALDRVGKRFEAKRHWLAYTRLGDNDYYLELARNNLND